MLVPDLDDVLVFKHHLRVEPIDSEVMYLVGEKQRFALYGASTVKVATLVDGRRTVEEILHLAGGGGAEPLFTLSQLLQSGYLVLADDDIPPETAAFWSALGVDARTAIDTLAESPVSLTVIGDVVPVTWMTDALVEAGVSVTEEGAALGPDGPQALHVVVTDDYLRPELELLGARFREQGASWVVIKPVGTRPLFGPLLRHDAGPCWECLAFAIRNNRPVEELVRRTKMEAAASSGAAAPSSRVGPQRHPTPPRTAEDGSVRTACGLGSLFVARSIVSMADAKSGSSHATMIALDLSEFQTTPHAVVRRPQCPSCGDPKLCAEIGQRRIELLPVEKAHYEDGGYRRQAPQETFEQLKHLVSPLTGAVTHVVPFPGRHSELRAVYASGYLVCPRAGTPHDNVFDKPCAGKGRSDEQARASAICEALERYSGVYRGDEARVRESLEAMGAAAVPLHKLLDFSERQYAARVPFSPSRMDWREFVPEPLDPTTPIDWSPGWSLTHDERRWVPLPYCYAEAPVESGTRYTRPCGNGVAAGTCIEEAILQGLLELVERDAAALWWYSRARRPAIDLASFHDSYFDALRRDYADRGWSVWALDLTHDLGIPACVALAHQPRSDRFSIGFGCHLEGKLAVQRALTELNQIFEPNGPRRAPWNVEAMRSREYLFPNADLPAAAANTLPSHSSDDLRADIEHCIARLRARELELIVVDKTRPDIGLSVAQVIVPGLRHFWPRFGPGRLYTVPPEIGWIDRVLGEDDLNPIHLFV